MSQAVAHIQKPSQSPPSYGAGSRAKARFTLRDVTSSLYLAPAAIVFLVFVVKKLLIVVLVVEHLQNLSLLEAVEEEVIKLLNMLKRRMILIKSVIIL